MDMCADFGLFINSNRSMVLSMTQRSTSQAKAQRIDLRGIALALSLPLIALALISL